MRQQALEGAWRLSGGRVLSTDYAREYTVEQIERIWPLVRRSNPFNPLPESVDSFLRPPFHHGDLLLRQPVQLVHQRINLGVEPLDLAGQVVAGVQQACLRCGFLTLQP